MQCCKGWNYLHFFFFLVHTYKGGNVLLRPDGKNLFYASLGPLYARNETQLTA